MELNAGKLSHSDIHVSSSRDMSDLVYARKAFQTAPWQAYLPGRITDEVVEADGAVVKLVTAIPCHLQYGAGSLSAEITAGFPEAGMEGKAGVDALRCQFRFAGRDARTERRSEYTERAVGPIGRPWELQSGGKAGGGRVRRAGVRVQRITSTRLRRPVRRWRRHFSTTSPRSPISISAFRRTPPIRMPPSCL